MLGSRKKYGILFLAFACALVASFAFNLYGAATEGFFKGHQRDSESLVVGRMVQSEKEGMLSHGGFLGGFKHDRGVDHQYKLFENGEDPAAAYDGYLQSAGLQGGVYFVLDSALRGLGLESGKSRLFLLKLVTSFLTAAVLSVFLLLVYHEVGLVTALLTLVLIASSQWIVVFSNNLYWMLFLIFLPFVFVSATLMLHERGHFSRMRFVYLGLLVLVLVKCLAGYEYISTILVSSVVPFFYFSIKNKWPLAIFLKRTLLASICAVVGFFAAIAIHIAQLSLLKGSLGEGASHVWFTVAKRTHGDPDKVGDWYRASLESNLMEVLAKYWHGDAFNLSSLVGIDYVIEFSQIITVLMILSAVSLVLILRSGRRHTKPMRTFLAALTVMWLSFLAPLSWHILAKAHSYVHGHMNHVLWYVPFLLIGFTFFGAFFKLSWINRRVFLREWKAFCLLLSLFAGVYLAQDYVRSMRKADLVLQAAPLEIVSANENFSLYVSGDQLVYAARVCDSSLKTRFFLHVYPQNVERLKAKSSKFDNFDFNWHDKQFISDGVVNLWREDVGCLASIQMPNYKVKGLRTGQFNSEGRLWQQYVDLGPFVPSKVLTPYDFSDERWHNGIHRSRAGFFVKNDFSSRQSIEVGDEVRFSHSGRRTVTEVSLTGSFINIFVSGEILDAELDGYPNEVGIGNPDQKAL